MTNRTLRDCANQLARGLEIMPREQRAALIHRLPSTDDHNGQALRALVRVSKALHQFANESVIAREEWE